MLYRLVLFLLLISTAFAAQSQSKRAFNLIEKEKYDQAMEFLQKSIQKDDIAAEAGYAMSVLFFTAEFPGFDADSAYKYILQSIEDFELTEEKEIEKLKKDNLDSFTLVNQKILIENYSFVLTKNSDLENDYVIFLEKYPTSLKADSAIWFRDLRAYERTSFVHNWPAYELYMNTYPESAQYGEAKKNYESLIYIDKTSDGKLLSYTQFLESYPDTPYRDEIEGKIFAIFTGDHTIGNYHQFILDYPNSHLVKKAAIRITMKKGASDITSSYINYDSLYNLLMLEKQNLFVRYEGQQFVFQASTYQIRNNFSWIFEGYKCGEIKSRLLLVKQMDTTRVVNRGGKIVFTFPGMIQIEDLGQGIVSFTTGSGSGAFLTSGELVAPPVYEEIHLIQDQYIGTRRNNKWELISVNGLQMNATYDVLENVINLVKIGRNDQFDLVSPDFFIPYLDGNSNLYKPLFTDLEILNNEMILLYKNDQQAIYTYELQPLVPFQKHELTSLPVGILAETSDGFRVHLRESLINTTNLWSDADYSEHWLMLKQDSRWNLFSSVQDTLFQSGLDSLRILNESAIQTYKGDSSFIIFTNGLSFVKSNECEMSIISSPPIKGKKRAYYYQLVLDDNSIILNEYLDTVRIPQKTKKITALGREYLLYTIKDKKGLLDSLGNELLEPEYDGIANYKNGSVTLLIDGELGLYNLKKDVLIPPEYHRSLYFYNDSMLVAFQDEKFGIISMKNDIILPLEYEKLQYFNDSIAWVSKGDTWNLLDFRTGNLVMDNVTSFSQPEGFAPDNYYFETPRGRGVANSKTGLIINGSFNDIQKEGTQIDPIYITELFVNEAGLYIQVVYDAKGNIIFRNAYSEEEYEKVICEK